MEALPLRNADRGVKQLKGKEIALVKVVWDGPAGVSMIWELESQMMESHPYLFLSGNFLGQKSYMWMRDVTPRLRNFSILIIFMFDV